MMNVKTITANYQKTANQGLIFQVREVRKYDKDKFVTNAGDLMIARKNYQKGQKISSNIFNTYEIILMYKIPVMLFTTEYDEQKLLSKFHEYYAKRMLDKIEEYKVKISCIQKEYSFLTESF